MDCSQKGLWHNSFKLSLILLRNTLLAHDIENTRSLPFDVCSRLENVAVSLQKLQCLTSEAVQAQA